MPPQTRSPRFRRIWRRPLILSDEFWAVDLKPFLFSAYLLLCPAPNRRGIKWWCCLTSVCLTSVTYIGPKSRTERPRKTKISTEVAHISRDSDTTFKVKKSKVTVTRPLYSPPCWRVRRSQRWVWERVGCWKLLRRCRLLGGARRPRGEERGGA